MNPGVGPAGTGIVCRFGAFYNSEIPKSLEEFSLHGLDIGLDLGAVKLGAYVCKL
jgi:hypothetical protein